MFELIFDFPKPIPMYNIAIDKKKNQGTRNATKRKTNIPRREFEMEPPFLRRLAPNRTPHRPT